MRTSEEYKELSIKEFTKAAKIYDATVFVETMNPFIVKNIKEKSIDKSDAKFTFGVKNEKALADIISSFSYVEEYSLAEGMSEFLPVYKLLKKIPFIANLSNKIIVLR